jgi:hypothetical protein
VKCKGEYTEALSEAKENKRVKVELIGLPEDRNYGDVEELLSKLCNIERRKSF